MSLKRTLLISFYWPPSGKASMHWPLKITEYFSLHGRKVDVLTVEKDTVSESDNSFSENINENVRVFRTNFLDPFTIYKRIIGKSADESVAPSESVSKAESSLARKLSIWIRMNLFIPDARAGWYFPAKKKGFELAETNRYDSIITNGPPHSAHLIGAAVAEKFNIPFIPVFIDPWVDISSYKGQKRNRIALAVDNYLESKIITSSRKTVFVTKNLKKYFSDKYPVDKYPADSYPADENKFEVLYWGYNEEEFANFNRIKNESAEKVILHAGNMFDHQNPINFWKTLSSKIVSGKKYKIQFIGTVGPAVKKSISEFGLDGVAEYLGFLPYKSMIERLSKADYLLVCVAEKRHIPGKLFEYMRSGIPIIAFADDNDEVAEILNSTNTGRLFKYSDSAEEVFDGNYSFTPNMELVKTFDREKIAAMFLEIINSL